MPKNSLVLSPNLGLYYDRGPLALAPQMLQDGNNFRVRDGKLDNLNVGWQRFQSNITLNGPVLLIYDFSLRDGTDRLIFGTKTDLYRYNPSGSGSVVYITPIYHTGTVAVSGVTVTGTGSAWSTATPRNVKIGDEIAFGSASQNLPSATWYSISNVGGDTTLTLATSPGTIAPGTTYTIRQKFQGGLDDLWVGDTFLNAAPENEDEVFLTNGVDLPIYWNGTTAQVQFLNNSFTCKALRVYNGMMIYMNVVQSGSNLPTTMINSDAAQPKVTNGTGISGQFTVHSHPGKILSAEKLGPSLAIYSEQALTLVQFVGDPTMFVFRQITFDKGLLAAKALTPFPSHHEYLGHDTMYRFDGATVTPINDHVWRRVLSQIDPTRDNRAYTHRDEESGEILWSVPSTVDPGSGTSAAPPSRAYGEHYLEYTDGKTPTPFSKRNFPFTATGFYSRQAGLTWDQLTDNWTQYNFRWNDQFFSASFPLNMAGTNDGKLYTFNSAQDADGVAQASFVRFGRRALFDGRNRGLVTRVYPFAETFSTPLTVTANMADYGAGAVLISQAKTFDQSEPEGAHFVSIFRAGRFVDLQFGSAGPAQPWVLEGYDMDVKPGGTR